MTKANEIKNVKAEKMIILKKKDSSVKSKLLKATMAGTTCCRGERS